MIGFDGDDFQGTGQPFGLRSPETVAERLRLLLDSRWLRHRVYLSPLSWWVRVGNASAKESWLSDFIGSGVRPA